MPLPAGTSLGSYEIVRPIGAGGMGEVYEARDVRLDRRVAIKVLSAEMVSRHESRDRFRREARTISQLQHPNICTLLDIGTHQDQDYLVLEYLEGETLSARIERGPIPVDDVLRIAAQIAAALDAAHRRGIVHRDLKPANVMLVRAGAAPGTASKSGPYTQVKLLDFGLAKEASTLAEAAEAATRSLGIGGRPLTAEGTLLGTYQYMAPEQIEGAHADARTDLWALGCVIYEMVTGERPFHGKTPASVMSAVLRDDAPSIASRQPLTPASLDRVVRTCLAKHPDERFSTAHDVAIALSWVREAGRDPASRDHERPTRPRWQTVIVSGLAIGLAGAAGYFAGAGRSPSPAMSWLDLAPEDLNAYDAPAVSPDGRSIVFSAKGRLWLRPTDSPRAEPLPGTEGARLPFWSPDSQSVAFGSSATGQLSRLDLRAGVTAPVRLCPIAQFRGGAWLPDDTILLAETWSPILKVPASGGTPVPLTHLDKEKGEGSHRFPTALPGGRFLYFSYTSAVSDAAIWVASVSNPSDRQLVVKSRSHAEYANGYLFYVSAGSLVAQRFDPRTGQLSGKQIVITARVGLTDIAGRHAFAASPAGTLVYVMPHTTLRQLAVVDRKGVVVRRIRGEEATYSVELSPDGDRVALTRDSETISIVNVQTEGDQPLFDGPDTGERWPVWSRDRKELFVSLPQGPFGNYNLFKVSPSGGPATPATIPDPQRMGAAGVGADGTLYWFGFVPASLGEDIFRQASGASKSEPFMTTAGSSEGPGRVSHDGKWIAYATTTAKDTQVVVRSLIDKGQSAMVSVSGGLQPRWGVLDKEIYFVAPDRWLMAAAIQLTPALKAERPQRLFPMDLLDCYDYCYDVFGDGNFLVNPVTTRGVPRLTVVQHWLGDSR